MQHGRLRRLTEKSEEEIKQENETTDVKKEKKQQNHKKSSVVNKTDKIFIGIVNKGDEAEWCVATTDQEVLQPVVEEVFERNDNLEFKKYKQPQSAVLN